MKKLLLSLGGLGIAGYILYKNFDFESEIINIQDTLQAKRKQFVSNKKTEDLIVSEFIEMIIVNCDITLEKAILEFENAKVDSLEEFAKTKNRTKESYLESYKPYFLKAQKLLAPSQTTGHLIL